MQGAYLSQHAVNAIADTKEVCFGFEVDIRGAAFDCIGQYRVDKPDDRLAVFVIRRRKTFPVDLPRFYLMEDAVDREFVAIVLID